MNLGIPNRVQDSEALNQININNTMNNNNSLLELLCIKTLHNMTLKCTDYATKMLKYDDDNNKYTLKNVIV